jgi:hypothetical protein
MQSMSERLLDELWKEGTACQVSGLVSRQVL